jgi:hypothetical protein
LQNLLLFSKNVTVKTFTSINIFLY